jgi:hypothetical protein
MSYDVWLEADLGSGPIGVGSLDANHTCNTGNMIAVASGAAEYTEGTTPSGWNGKRAAEVAKICWEAIRELRAKPDDYRKYEPENKWGTVETAIEFLEIVLTGCLRAPQATVRVG